MDASGSGQGPVAVPCEHCNEPSGSIKGGEFLDQLNDYYLLKMDSAPWSYLEIGYYIMMVTCLHVSYSNSSN
jgi:hypothetical protein